MKVKKLKIFSDQKKLVDISFEIKKSLALVGQSGSGKSLTLKALLDMLPSNLRLEKEFESSISLKKGEDISFIPQNPFTSLSPLTKIKNQFFCSDKKKLELFTLVGLDKELLERFPPELSGGQLQRVVIAIALENSPKLILLDEPTTALDNKSKDLILSLLKSLQEKDKFMMLFVTHDIASASELCEEIVVIKDGSVVESGKTSDVLKNPQESYTKILIESNFTNRKFRE